MEKHRRIPDVQQGLVKPGLAARVDELRAALRLVPFEALVERTATGYLDLGPGRGEFHFSLLGSALVLSCPEFIAYNAQDDVLPAFIQALVLYYFHTSDGLPLAGRWVSFAELPDGRVYNAAFQGYTGDELVKTFGLDLEAFKNACLEAGGVPEASFGDAAFVIQALPRIPVLVNYWCGDEDFPSACKLLFDPSVSHYLPAEARAILGSMLTRKLIKNAHRQ